jgi:hypothetical protein
MRREQITLGFTAFLGLVVLLGMLAEITGGSKITNRPVTPPLKVAGASANAPLPRPVMGITPTSPAISATPRPTSPASVAVNGVAVDKFVVMPASVQQNIRKIYAQGQAGGNNSRAFSKVGDSTIENPYFLARFDGGPYNLGDYANLQSVIEFFAGSFGRPSAAVHKGLHAWSMLNPMWADKALCQPAEAPLGCEFRLHKPSLVLVRLGANDTGAPQLFRDSLQAVVEFSIQHGVIPVLGTKPDRHEGSDNTNNIIIRRLAADNHIPLWDFDLVAQTLPGRGLDVDGVHMTTFYAHDYTRPEAFQRGHSVHNLTALIVLDRIWGEIRQNSR